MICQVNRAAKIGIISIALSIGLYSKVTVANQCYVAGNTLSEAVAKYNKQCVSDRADCDLLDGQWYCSSEQIDSTALSMTSRQSPVLQQPNHQSCVDTDGDGWGWNGVSSCKLNLDERTEAANNSESGFDVVRTTLTEECIDTDGDGWGWNGTASCKVADVTQNQDATIRPPIARHNVVVNQQSSIPENCHKINSGDYHITDLVTDVFLSAGQSNAAGGNTRYRPATNIQDRINSRVIVWTENNRWEVADPNTQTWHNGEYPSGKGESFNHPAFQIGRAIADQDECRVVAFIATAASGMPIDYWRNNQDDHFTEISNKVTNAINALPTKHSVDMIWWMQGESDNDEIVSRYFWKLNAVIDMFRNESWFPTNGYFLANETGWSPYANEAIRMLGEDNDVFTDYSRGEESVFDAFPPLGSEKLKTHFNEVSLRKIGDLVAYKYLNQYLNAR